MPDALGSCKDAAQHSKDFSQQDVAKVSTKPDPKNTLFTFYMAKLAKYHQLGYLEENNHQWHTPILHFVRYAKAHPKLFPLPVDKAVCEIEKVMASWQKADKQIGPDPWQGVLGVSRADAHAEFYRLWDEVRNLPGYEALENAVERARCTPINPTARYKKPRPAQYAEFISIAGWLQVAQGDQNIMLPVEMLNKILKVTPMTISNYRKWAIEDGFLKEATPYEFHGKGNKQNKATEFRFDVNCCQVLREAAQKGTAASFTAA